MKQACYTGFFLNDIESLISKHFLPWKETPRNISYVTFANKAHRVSFLLFFSFFTLPFFSLIFVCFESSFISSKYVTLKGILLQYRWIVLTGLYHYLDNESQWCLCPKDRGGHGIFFRGGGFFARKIFLLLFWTFHAMPNVLTLCYFWAKKNFRGGWGGWGGV